MVKQTRVYSYSRGLPSNKKELTPCKIYETHNRFVEDFKLQPDEPQPTGRDVWNEQFKKKYIDV